MSDTATACMHWVLGNDEVCEECGKTPGQVAAEQQTRDREAYVAGLRELADWLEQHPEFQGFWYGETFNMPVQTKEQLAAAARSFGKCEKYGDDDWFGVRRRFGPHRIDVYGGREKVCTRVVKGTREVEREIPDPKAPTVTVTQTVEDVEWICEPLLAAEEAA